MSRGRIEYLDCTIRDGGYRNNWNFSKEEVFNCYKHVSDANFDYFEVGFMRSKSDPNSGIWNHVSIQDIQEVKSFHDGCKISVMVSVEGNSQFSLPSKDHAAIDLVRVHLRIKDFSKEKHRAINAFNMCNRFLDEGYEVTLNLASADKLTSSSIHSISSMFANIKLKALYIADTFGNLNEESTAEKISEYKKSLDLAGSLIPIGFHSHNNLGNALAKSKVAISNGATMIDMTLLGLGRGAGNLRSEFFAMDQAPMMKTIKILPILKACDSLSPDDLQKRSVIHAMLGNFNIHPKYESLCNGKSLEESYVILQELINNLPEDTE